MGRLIYIDLGRKKVVEKENKKMDYGRGLIAKIINEQVPPNADRLSKENVIVLVPGLLSGTLAPSTGRLLVGTKASKDRGIQISNIAGTISQRLASLDIDGVILTGINQEETPLTLVIEENNITLNILDDIKKKEVSATIEVIHRLLGKDCGIIGIGPSGENLLPVSTLFSTYPEGEPSFYCARNGMGDVFGHKGVKAVVVKNKEHFKAPVVHEENMREVSKKLSRIIIDHPICGKALPELGPITLMKMLVHGKNIDLNESYNKEKLNHQGPHINRTCSPLCVVGCLNRHVKLGEEYYSAPVEIEIFEALRESFGIEDRQYVKEFTNKCFELGIDCMEFIFSCALYFNLQSMEGNIKQLDNSLKEVKNMTLVGRILASKTKGIYSLFRDKEEYEKMVSKPSIIEEKNFNVDIQSKEDSLSQLTDLDYLYAYIIVLENLGFCLFTSFAFIENGEALDLLKDMYWCKTGIKIEGKDILQYAINTLESERAYEREAKLEGVSKMIPNFVKVLYRYFHKN